jgi:hypothetical protein
MYEIVNVKIKLDILRTELDDELLTGTSINKVRRLHSSIKVLEKILLHWEKLPNSVN